MTRFNVLLFLISAALVALVLGDQKLSVVFTTAALLDALWLRNSPPAVPTREEPRDEPDDDRVSYVAAVLQGMAWAQAGMVYQLDEGEDPYDPSYALIGRTLVDAVSGETLFLPQMEVGPAGCAALPAYAARTG